MKTLLHHVKRLLKPNGIRAFVDQLGDCPAILDIGCGNKSVLFYKFRKPDSYYVGYDVVDYNQSVESMSKMDEYIVVPKDCFVEEISQHPLEFDAIICSHNLEHVDQKSELLTAIAKKCKRGGRVYISFPCSVSIGFPSRKGCLNFYDDPTHTAVPPSLDEVRCCLIKEGLEIEYLIERHKPKILYFIGLVLEPFSALLMRNFFGTWEYYGFETIIVANKT